MPSFAFGQEGRKALVFQVSGGASNAQYALKIFKQAFRVPDLVEVCDGLAQYSTWRGLEVCDRVCLHRPEHADAIDKYDDLEYAVLMPWITGSTWYDIVVSETPLTRVDALTFANATAQVLAALEESGLAHCDVAAPNIIINATTGMAHLIDVEDMFAPGFAPPGALPAGTDGYAHLTASTGLWNRHADRFAGAVLIAEMAAWHDPEIRDKADEEHYFGAQEMQQDVPRYQLIKRVLTDLDPPLAELFEQAWFSEELSDAPALKEWQDAVDEVYRRVRLEKVAPEWRSIIPTGVDVDIESAPPVTVAPIAPPVTSVGSDEVVSEEGEPLLATVAEQDDLAPEPEPEAQELPEPLPQNPRVMQETPAAQQVAKTPPSTQPVNPPPAAPQTIQPGLKPSVGGPVAEWRSLSVVPQPSPVIEPSPTAFEPIVAPQSSHELEPEFVPMIEEEDVEDHVEDMLPFEDGVDVEDEEPFDDAPTPAHEFPTLDADEEASYDDFEEPVYEAEEDEQVVETPDWEPEYELATPILDLSHIDDRNRPFLVWSESHDATGYLLQESGDSDFGKAKEFTLNANETRWNPRMRRNGRLFYRVRAENDREVSPWSDTLSLRIGPGGR